MPAQVRKPKLTSLARAQESTGLALLPISSKNKPAKGRQPHPEQTQIRRLSNTHGSSKSIRRERHFLESADCQYTPAHEYVSRRIPVLTGTSNNPLSCICRCAARTRKPLGASMLTHFRAPGDFAAQNNYTGGLCLRFRYGLQRLREAFYAARAYDLRTATGARQLFHPG